MSALAVVYEDEDLRVLSDPKAWGRSTRVERRVGDGWELMRGVQSVQVFASVNERATVRIGKVQTRA
jgi:hypothetical protein